MGIVLYTYVHTVVVDLQGRPSLVHLDVCLTAQNDAMDSGKLGFIYIPHQTPEAWSRLLGGM